MVEHILGKDEVTSSNLVVGYDMEFCMDCPRCSGILAESSYEGFPVMKCAGCGGFWIGGKVLLSIIDKRKTEIPEAALRTANEWRHRQIPKEELDNEFKCPVCGSKLNRSVYGYDTGIVIDRCLNDCGIWLESGELVALRAFDEVWNERAREIFRENGLQKIFDEAKNEEDPKTAVIRRGFFGRSIIGRLADIFVDFLS